MKLGAALARAAFFAVLLLLGLALALAGTRDGRAPDDSDLRVLPAAPADFANAQITLTSAAALLVRDERDSRWEGFASGAEWDDEPVARSLRANEASLRAFARAARQGAFQSSGTETAQELVAWIELARLQGMRAISLARSGDAPAAAAATLENVRIARLVGSDTRGSPLLREVAGAMADASFSAAREALRHTELDSTSAGALARELASASADVASVRAQLAAAYREFSSSEDPREDLQAAAKGAAARYVASVLPSRHRYQPNNTLALYAERTRAQITSAGESCGTDDTPPLFAPSLRSLLESNPEGRRRIDAASAQRDVRRSACAWNTRIEALRGAIAVQQFERARGTLPPSLEALAPDYLPEPPRDWFGNGALRLDRAKREIVSAGRWDTGAEAVPIEERFPLLPASAAVRQSQPSPM
jgi:hypothetical protein